MLVLNDAIGAVRGVLHQPRRKLQRLGIAGGAIAAVGKIGSFRQIDAQQPRSASEQLRLFLLREAHDAAFILDLHCDTDSLPYIYTSPELMPELQDLSDWMGAAAVLQAWQDVVNALLAHRLEQNRRARLRSQADHSRAALALAPCALQ